MTKIDHMEDPLTAKIENVKEHLLSPDEPEVPFYDFCTTFQMEDNIQNDLFNEEFNQPHLIWLFVNPQTGKKTPPFTNEMLFAITTRIINKSHILLFIFGKTNSGKSEFAQSIAKYLKSEFYRIHHINIEVHIGFSDADLGEISPNLGYGHLFLRDESTDISGEDSGLLRKQIGNLVRVVRADQNSFLFVNPDLIEDPMVDYYIRIAGKKRVYQCNECGKEVLNKLTCPTCKSTNLEPIYSKCQIRAIVYYRQNDPLSNKAFFIPLGRMYLSLHTDQELRETYQRKKDENIQYIKKLRGLLGVHRDEAKLTAEAQILANLCIKDGITTKIGMQLKMVEYNGQFQKTEAEKMIGGSNSYNKLLLEKTSQLLDNLDFPTKGLINDDTDQEESEKSLDELIVAFKNYEFSYSEADIISRAKKNARFRNIDRDFEIFSKVQEGKLYDSILVDYPDLTDISSISKIVTKVQNLINQVKGAQFENDYVKHLQSIYSDKVIHDGRTGMPDAYVIIEEANELHIFSLKCISTHHIPREEARPEQTFALNNIFNYKKIRLFHIANIDYTIFVYEDKDLTATNDIIFR